MAFLMGLEEKKLNNTRIQKITSYLKNWKSLTTLEVMHNLHSRV